MKTTPQAVICYRDGRLVRCGAESDACNARTLVSFRAGQAPSGGSKPCMLNDEIEARMCEYLRQGASLEDAAAMCGIGTKTLTEWRAHGCRDMDSRFGQFFEATELAHRMEDADAPQAER